MNIFIFTKLRYLLNRLGLIKSGTGLSENFEYNPDPNTTFLKSAHSLKNADTILDGVLGQATNEINVLGLRIDGVSIIDAHGNWVHDKSEIIGPQGEQGIQGIQGISGINGTNGLNGNTGLQGTTGSNGLQGNTGVQGFQGIQGITGFQGIQGIIGSTGTQGTQGLAGNSVAVKGTVTSPASLPGTGTIGDIYIMSQSGTGYSVGDGYVFSTGNVWINIGQFRGSQGLQGNTGAGLQGVQGALGIQGIQGRQGIQGVQGIIGNTGIQGTQGTLGIQGSLGVQGIQGIQGVQSLQGRQGIQGNQGIVGNVSYEVFISSNEPTPSDGKNGDIWLTYHSF